MRGRYLIYCLFLVSLLFSNIDHTSASYSGIMAPLDQLYYGSDFAFTGIAGPIQQGDGFYRYYEFTDVHYLKKDLGKDTIQIRIMGGTVGDLSLVTTAPQPSFMEGYRYLVFVDERNDVYRVYFSTEGYYLLEGGSFSTNIVQSRADSSIDSLVIGTVEKPGSLNSEHLFYGVSLILAVILGVVSIKWKGMPS